jgi:V8-like Glu-specific endopeptidase
MWTSGSCYGSYQPRTGYYYMVTHKCDTEGGMSGSALIQYYDIVPYVRGIHMATAGSVNGGLALFDAHYRNLRTWSGRG